RADFGFVATVAAGGKPRRQAPAAFGFARIRLDRTGRRRRPVRLPRGILPPDAQAAGVKPREIRRVARRCRQSAWQGGSDHRQTTPWPDRHGRIAVRCGGDTFLVARARSPVAGSSITEGARELAWTARARAAMS